MSLFVVLSLAYNGGSFTVTLDPNFRLEAGLAIYTEKEVHKHVRKLYAEELKFMDNISIDWLPRNIKDFTGGSHNGDNYIAYTFYSEARVQEVINADKFQPINEEINLDEIVIDTKPRDSYDNEFDEAILTRDPGNEHFKYLKIKVGKYDAHLVAIYDPSEVRILTSKKFNTTTDARYGGGQEKMINMTKRLGATVGINGGGFVDYGYGSDIPLGYVIKDGKVIWKKKGGGKGNLIGFTNDNKLLLINATGAEAIEQGMRDALEFGPFLIVNGVTPQFNNVVGGYSRAARVAIAQRKDGIVLFLVTEGTHTAGPNMKEVIDTLANYGAWNAANLDGGTSTQLVINGQLKNNPKNIYGNKVEGGRSVVTGWGLIPGAGKTETETE